jgi:hypothetical protein
MYKHRRRYLAIYPAQHPDNITPLVLDDQLLMEKKSYVSTMAQHTISWKFLKPYWDRPSRKQFRLKADSLDEVLKHAKLSILTKMPKDLDPVPTTSKSTMFPTSSHRPLAPISANSVRKYESDMEHRAGTVLPKRSRVQPFPTYDTPLAGSATYSTLNQKEVPPSPFWSAARPALQHLLGHSYIPQASYHDHSHTPQTSYRDHSAMLPFSNQSDLEQGDPKLESTTTSWLTIPRCLFANFVVGVYGFFTLFSR